ncbi:MAG: SHOCT domain-containing protein [Desulfobacterales bacterium]
MSDKHQKFCLAPATSLGNHYQIIKPIGQGGMGSVYLAFDTRLELQVAIKVISPEFSRTIDEDQLGGVLKRFETEAKIAAKIDHPNVKRPDLRCASVPGDWRNTLSSGSKYMMNFIVRSLSIVESFYKQTTGREHYKSVHAGRPSRTTITRHLFTREVEAMKTRYWLFFTSAFSATVFLGCVQRPMDGSVGGWNHMMGYGGYGGMFMWLILLILVGVVIYFVFERSKRAGTPDAFPRESPIDILKRRYAGGEITKEEFDRLKREIEN